MIIPSIDIVGGKAVQLVGGETLAIDAGDPLEVLERFSVVGEVAVVDIDAARGEGDNSELIAEMCRRARVRVGGGIRTVDRAIGWLDAGAVSIVIGTAATPSFLTQLPRERVIVALDGRNDEVVTHGWRRGTGRTVLEVMGELKELAGGFLVTFVEREGRLEGTDLDRAARLIEGSGDSRVTIAGGITTIDEIAALDRIGADAQVGMALYMGRFDLGEAMAAVLNSDRTDGLWPTVVTDELGRSLGLAWSDEESLRMAIATRTGTYRSRKRGLWVKGETSGATQELLDVSVDCDRDALRFTVRQTEPGFCHRETHTCWGEDAGLGRLARRLERIRSNRPEGSNTVQLLDRPELLAAKLTEEAAELAEAGTTTDVTHEAADLIYFTLVKTIAAGVSLEDIESELDRRELRISRRAMSK